MNANLGAGGTPPAGPPSFSPMDVLNAARKAVPAVDFALGAAGVAAAAAIIIAFLGNGRAAFIILGGMVVSMVLLFVFSRLVTAQNTSTIRAGIALMWMVVAFFGIFLFFTATAFAFRWPPAWAQALGIDTTEGFDKKAMNKLLEVPNEISSRVNKVASKDRDELIRLQPRLSDLVAAQREAVLSGGGAYYSFVRRTHEYGFGSDIELWPGVFKTGFAGTDYGFFMYLGQATPNELATLKPDVSPNGLEPTRADGWKYMWDYKPPSDIKIVRGEQKRSRGFAIGGATLSNQAAVSKGGLYLLRSILFERSDILVAFHVVDLLNDGSAVLAWRTLKIFDTPVMTGTED